MAWLLWTGIAVFITSLLAVSYWHDRDARKRGATPSSAGSMVEAARSNRWEVVRRGSAQLQGGMTPRSQDAHDKTWKKP